MQLQTETCIDLQRLTEAGRHRQRDASNCTEMHREKGSQRQTETG